MDNDIAKLKTQMNAILDITATKIMVARLCEKFDVDVSDILKLTEEQKYK